MPPDPPRGYRLRRAFIRTPLRQILDPPQVKAIYLYAITLAMKVIERKLFHQNIY